MDIVRVTPLPFLYLRDKYAKPIFDADTFIAWINRVATFVGEVFIEAPQLRPHESPKSVSTSWWNAAQVHCACARVTDKIHYFTPKQWKPVLHPFCTEISASPKKREEWKQVAVGYVRARYGEECLFPARFNQAGKPLKTSSIPNDGIADAICIAEAGIKVLLGKLDYHP